MNNSRERFASRHTQRLVLSLLCCCRFCCLLLLLSLTLLFTFALNRLLPPAIAALIVRLTIQLDRFEKKKRERVKSVAYRAISDCTRGIGRHSDSHARVVRPGFYVRPFGVQYQRRVVADQFDLQKHKM